VHVLLTLLLGGSAQGDFKLKLMLVCRSPNPRAPKGYKHRSLPVIRGSNRKASVAQEIFNDWLASYFCPAVQKFCRESNIVFKVPVILSDAPRHPTRLGSLYENVKIILFAAKHIFVAAHGSRDHRNI
jgi:hypothetical protein